MARRRGNAILGIRKALSSGLAIMILLLFMNSSLALAQVAGKAVSCGCYCGVMIPPPCSDEACKKACGWRGGSGGGSPAATSPADAATGMMQQFNQLERQNRENALQQQQQMMRSLDDMSRERMRLEDEMLGQAAERARRLDDQRRDETLSTLSGIPRTDELTLKPSTDFFGISGNPKGDPASPMDSSVVDLRHLDPSKPVTVDQNVLRENRKEPQKQREDFKIMDCEKRKATRDRLAAGLPVQLEAIKRTEAQLETARKGVAEATGERRQVLIQGAVQEAKEYAKEVLTSAKAIRAQVELLKDLDVNKAERDMLIRSLNTIVWEGEGLAEAFQAGNSSGAELKSKVDKLSKHMLTLADKMLMQSGIAEKGGEELAGKMWGPLGELGFRGTKLSIDFGVALGKGMISQKEREAAQRNLDIMRSQNQRAEQRISELDKDLAEVCKDRLQVHQ
jgi:hypothetical protein